MKVCLATVVSPDRYSFYIPSFVYSAKRAYPEYGVKVFVRGKLPKAVKKLLSDMRSKNLCANDDWEVLEDQFLNYPHGISICNTLRHLIPAKHFTGCDYVYITDIDFIIFRHEITLGEYFAKRMSEMDLPYASFRGPYNTPRRPGINGNGWRGNFVRIADGTLMLKNPEWFTVTKRARAKYKKLVRTGTPDGIDPSKPASYREYNEVMLFRICRSSGLKTPTIKRKFVNKKSYNCLFRDIHIGDFRYARKDKPRKMRRYIPTENVQNFRELEKDPVWKKICSEIEQEKTIKKIFKNMRRYMGKRKK